MKTFLNILRDWNHLYKADNFMLSDASKMRYLRKCLEGQALIQFNVTKTKKKFIK